MKIERRSADGRVQFVVRHPPTAYRDALGELGFAEMGDSFFRSFPEDSPHLDQAFENFAREGEEMILQQAGLRTADWRLALSAVIERIRDTRGLWFLIGSASLAARGLEVTPADVDIVTNVETAFEFGDLLADFLVEPVAQHAGFGWFGRAMCHARVEWLGGTLTNPEHLPPSFFPTSEPESFWPADGSWWETIPWEGRAIRVPPLENQVRVAEAKGVADRAAVIRQWIDAKPGIEG
jgi:hypothetical protein